MSERRIWEVDERALAAARAAGWRESDLEWESASERALALAGEGEWGEAAGLWSRALVLARERFAPDDPRLGCGLANFAAAPFFRGEGADAKALAEAREVWARGPGWIDRMRMEQRARSSVHHLRMEAKNRRIYDAAARRRLHDFAAEAREALEHFARGGEVAPRPLKRWRAESPPIFGDSRKILSACLLLSFAAAPRR